MSNNTVESHQTWVENDIFAKEIKLFSEEQKELQSDIEQHIAWRKDVHKAFINNIEKTLSEESKTAINTLFGWKNLKEWIDNFLLERRKVEELNTKWESWPLANHEFSLFLRGDPETNTILKEYYKDFTELKAWKKKKEDLLTKYDISKKDQKEIDELKKARASENKTKEEIPLDVASAGVISQYEQEEAAINDKGPDKKEVTKEFKNLRSSGIKKEWKTGNWGKWYRQHYCSKTSQIDGKRLFHMNLKTWNAFHAMYKGINENQERYKGSVIAKQYLDYSKQYNDILTKSNSWFSDCLQQIKQDDAKLTKLKNEEMGTSETIDTQAHGANFWELYVTSKWQKQYGHRALLFCSTEGSKRQRYVIDPYTRSKSWKDSNEPRRIEDYTVDIDGKREFMRMDFYNAPVTID